MFRHPFEVCYQTSAQYSCPISQIGLLSWIPFAKKSFLTNLKRNFSCGFSEFLNSTVQCFPFINSTQNPDTVTNSSFEIYDRKSNSCAGVIRVKYIDLDLPVLHLLAVHRYALGSAPGCQFHLPHLWRWFLRQFLLHRRQRTRPDLALIHLQWVVQMMFENHLCFDRDFDFADFWNIW